MVKVNLVCSPHADPT
jgi:hypothetical protein